MKKLIIDSKTASLFSELLEASLKILVNLNTFNINVVIQTMLCSLFNKK